MRSSVHPRRTVWHLTFLLAGAALLLSCSSAPPARLYVLEALASPAAGSPEPGEIDANKRESGSSDPSARAASVRSKTLGVIVIVPQYLDRREIIIRSGPNEIRAMENDRWADDLAPEISRTLAGDLCALLPAYEVVTLPSRLGLTIDYQVRVELTRFEITEDWNTAIDGRWSIVDASDGTSRASGRIIHQEHAHTPEFTSVAAAMSHNLDALSVEIAAAVSNVSSSGRPRP